MKRTTYVILLLSIIFTACSGEDPIPASKEDNKIVLSFSVNNYTTNITKSTSIGSEDEQKINDLYIFLFPTVATQSLIKYYTTSSSFGGGTWDKAGNKILLDITQAEVGNRNVYIVTNSSAIKTDLDNVTSLTQLQGALQTISQPWSANINTPLLMSGNKTHDFNDNYQLNSISLIRCMAKLQLNIKLSPEHQTTPSATNEYKYKLINFDKNTYVLKPDTKPDNLVSSADWTLWDAAGALTSYSLTNGKVTSLSLTTYLNERTNAGTAIEVSLPYESGGVLPPPEFGNETYKLSLPTAIERNHWYIYDIEI